jgi:hypothetical protein
MVIFSFSHPSDCYGQMVEYGFCQPAWFGILRRNELGEARARWTLKFYKTSANRRMPFQISSSFSVV